MVLESKHSAYSGGELVRSRAVRAEEKIFMAKRDGTSLSPELKQAEEPSELLRELVAHLRQNRTQLREEWVVRITETRLLTAMTKEELFAKYQNDFKKLNLILDAYEPAANRIANTVAVGFVQERERVIRQQQEAIRELSTPVLQVRERLLILPIIGVIDPQRARQLTEQLLRGIRTNRAKVVVIDITGVAAMDATVANHLVQTVEASRLLGATVIVTGLSPEIAQTLVTIGVDLGKMNTVGDLQGGIEQAERLLGYKVATVAEPN